MWFDFILGLLILIIPLTYLLLLVAFWRYALRYYTSASS